MILLLIFLILALAIFIGWIISNKYIKRDNFFKGLVCFCDTSFNEINFLHTKLLDLIDKDCTRGDFHEFLLCFKNFLQTSQSRGEFEQHISKKFTYLKNEEIKNLCNFFCGIGKKDVESELANISNYKGQFVSMKRDAESDKKKYAGLYFKLSLLAGVVVSILVI